MTRFLTHLRCLIRLSCKEHLKKTIEIKEVGALFPTDRRGFSAVYFDECSILASFLQAFHFVPGTYARPERLPWVRHDPKRPTNDCHQHQLWQPFTNADSAPLSGRRVCQQQHGHEQYWKNPGLCHLPSRTTASGRRAGEPLLPLRGRRGHWRTERPGRGKNNRIGWIRYLLHWL